MILTASERKQVAATLTAGFDGPQGLFLAELFQPECRQPGAGGP